MSREDYIRIAAKLALTRPADRRELPQSSNEPARFMRNQWLADRDAIADILADDNPAFDRKRFNEATEK